MTIARRCAAKNFRAPPNFAYAPNNFNVKRAADGTISLALDPKPETSQTLDLGYRYLAITDHSERALCSRTLSRSDVTRQREAVRDIETRYPTISLLHGVEVEIMPDAWNPDMMPDPGLLGYSY